MDKTTLTGRSLEKELFINASPERVFRALTEKEELERWFLMKAEIDLRPGGSLKFEWSPDASEVGKVLALEPPYRVSYSWEALSPSPTTITFELTPENGGTRLRLTHDSIGEGQDWDNYYSSVNGGWNAHLKDLASWLETGTCDIPGSRGQIKGRS
jgi:uncharacterized protein YndB with AHSA1/START domain